ncbi:peptidoglycan DD-metalloendopeptidase family protein [Candidatus Nitrosoglobus terrae]|uniref:peptidoglycan DD-metalloendopeptidase family protein n=1 Tax=Candidatus Nitrosoglobus terrae TaxID=1630141 RepID=UPI0022B267CF|nr:peptidoglycan DD-metalloendopeptidase family protein [Candidatus Nitrosoglobus terrae]
MRFLLVIVIFFTGCGIFGSGPHVSYYTVKPGDTLYTIGWAYGLDYKNLASWNEIDSPYTIYVGQKLRLTSLSEDPLKHQGAPKLKQRIDNNNVEIQPKLATRPPLNKIQPTSSKKHLISWRWPTEGKIIQSFSNTTLDRKGIDIVGQLGQPVVAAADGEVVYSGMGLPRYGKLIIIKHNNSFLSAYAHNRLLVTEEGSLVKGGQKIAEMGRSGTDQVKLHFEIRYNGQPVDPLNYLPKL